MDWQKIKERIQSSIYLKMRLDDRPNIAYKIVVRLPNDKIHSYRVQVGADNFIEISFEMLELIFDASLSNNGIYNKAIIIHHYPSLIRNKPCFVNAVGKIFTSAKAMEQVSARDYRILY